MAGMGKWILCGLVGIFGVAGLFVAAGAGPEPVPYWGGIGFFVFAVLFIFLQMKRAYDHADHSRH